MPACATAPHSLSAVILRLAVIAACCFVAAACSRKEPPSKTGNASNNHAVQQFSGVLKVKIAPDSPTVSTDLHGLYEGGGQAAYQWQKNGRPIPGADGVVLSRSAFVKGEAITFLVTANGQEGSALVVIGNSLPEITAVPFTPDSVYAGVDISVAPVARDPDGDPVSFSCIWKVNDREASREPLLKGDLFKRGDRISLQVTPADNEGPGTPFTSREMIVPNAPPGFMTTPPVEFKGDSYTYEARASDPDGDTVSYSLVSGPPGMTVDGRTGTVNWPLNAAANGTHTVEIKAQDTGGAHSTQRYSLTIRYP